MTVVSLSPPGRFDPLPEDHPAVGGICPGCDQPLAAGDRVALCNGIPADEDEQAKADAGQPHNVRVTPAHEGCVDEWRL